MYIYIMINTLIDFNLPLNNLKLNSEDIVYINQIKNNPNLYILALIHNDISRYTSVKNPNQLIDLRIYNIPNLNINNFSENYIDFIKQFKSNSGLYIMALIYNDIIRYDLLKNPSQNNNLIDLNEPLKIYDLNSSDIDFINKINNNPSLYIFALIHNDIIRYISVIQQSNNQLLENLENITTQPYTQTTQPYTQTTQPYIQTTQPYIQTTQPIIIYNSPFYIKYPKLFIKYIIKYIYFILFYIIIITGGIYIFFEY